MYKAGIESAHFSGEISKIQCASQGKSFVMKNNFNILWARAAIKLIVVELSLYYIEGNDRTYELQTAANAVRIY